MCRYILIPKYNNNKSNNILTESSIEIKLNSNIETKV